MTSEGDAKTRYDTLKFQKVDVLLAPGALPLVKTVLSAAYTSMRALAPDAAVRDFKFALYKVVAGTTFKMGFGVKTGSVPFTVEGKTTAAMAMLQQWKRNRAALQWHMLVQPTWTAAPRTKVAAPC